MGAGRVVALVAARNEADRIGDAVRAVRTLPAVGEIVVIDDGSEDDTSQEAAAAGARVLVAPRRVGKGEALEAALSRIGPADVWLLIDGDTGASAAGATPLLEEVLSGRADLAIGVLPAPPTGGFGMVKGGSRAAIRRIAGFGPREPMSGQRAVTGSCLEACRPIAGGFGVETAMTADAVRLGFRVVEVPVAMEHRHTRKDLPGFLHRAKQGLDMARAVLPRLAGIR